MQPITNNIYSVPVYQQQTNSNRVSRFISNWNCWPGMDREVAPLRLRLHPLFLDQATTQEIIDFLKTGPLIDVSTLTRPQLLRLGAILTLPDTPQDMVNLMPPFVKDFMSILRKWAYKQLSDEEEKNIYLAHVIEKNENSIKTLSTFLKEEELLRLAPYMHYVDLCNFPDIELGRRFLQRCTNVNHLLFNDGRLIEGLQELPCQILDCSNSINLTALPALPRCQDLKCIKTELTSLPALPLCRKLYCNESPSIATIGALPLCQDLQCYNCPSLTALPELPCCEKINCTHCDLLESIRALPLCKELDMSNCKSLTALPPLPACQKLTACACTNLTALPALPMGKEINVSGSGLRNLSALPLCKTLDCCSCRHLTALPALPECEVLDCSNCSTLTALPQLPHCSRLACRNCSLLISIPPLPLCQTLHCSGCNLAELPEVPFYTHVFTAEENINALPSASLEIDLEMFAADPIALLLKLGEFLLKNEPFPNIYYFEKGVRNLAIDLGGVRRDFVTKLCTHLFNAPGLKLDDHLPSARTENEERAYRALGSLLAYCIPAHTFYKTGPLFDSVAYRCIETPNSGTDEWFLTNYLQLINAPALELFDLNPASIAYLAEPDISDVSLYTQQFIMSNREAIRQSVLLRAKQDARLKAIAWMAQEIRKKMPKLPPNLQQCIEGIVTKEALKKKLSWKNSNPKTENYLANWIDKHEELLPKFLYAVTGIRTLCAHPLVMDVYDRAKNFIPIAHTCSFTLELSGNYENQAVFDEKLNYFLENALAGSGFTAA